jgi:transposase
MKECLTVIQNSIGGSTMNNIKVLGIDLAKNIFQLHGTDAKGKCVLRKRISREKLAEFVVQIKPCMIGIEACMGAHYWARLFQSMGHTVKIMAPQFVKPYVMSNKNDPNDARGIAEAVTRPNMKFVSVKQIEQQDMLLLHSARDLMMKQKIAQSNQIRGLLMEYGIVIPQGIYNIKMLLQILEDNHDKLTTKSLAIFTQLYEQFKMYDDQLAIYDKQLNQIVNQNAVCKEIMKIEGIGPITASAIIATIGDAKVFKNGREVAAWLGLVPKQHSSGNTVKLSGISKRGNSYVRKLLVQGARSVVNTCTKKQDKRNLWIADKKNRCGYNKASVALANKNARIIWAIMAKGECYRKSIII